MGQEDIFKRQLDLLSAALGKALAKILKIKDDSEITELKQFFKAIDEELNIDIDDLLTKPPAEFLNLLNLKYGFKTDHLDKLAEIFFETAQVLHKQGEIEKSQLLFSRSVLLYESISTSKKEVSLDRVYRMAEIKRMLEGMD